MRWSLVDFPGYTALRLAAEDGALVRVEFVGGGAPASSSGVLTEGVHDDADPLLRRAADELAEYFARRRERFTIPLRPRGTSFQLSVWEQLRAIPYGVTRSYRDLANAIGRPAATRAVGAANGANPLPIFLPCHRVVGSNGTLTGFGGGIELKAALLRLEGVLL